MVLNLLEIRSKKHITQQQVADYLNCTTVTYCRYEKGVRMPSPDTLVKLAKFFQVSVDYLVGHTSSDSSSLTEEEISLVEAARAADSRAFQDALELLKRNKR